MLVLGLEPALEQLQLGCLWPWLLVLASVEELLQGQRPCCQLVVPEAVTLLVLVLDLAWELQAVAVEGVPSCCCCCCLWIQAVVLHCCWS